MPAARCAVLAAQSVQDDPPRDRCPAAVAGRNGAGENGIACAGENGSKTGGQMALETDRRLTAAFWFERDPAVSVPYRWRISASALFFAFLGWFTLYLFCLAALDLYFGATAFFQRAMFFV